MSNVRVELHVHHLAPLLALVRASKDSRWQPTGHVLREMPEATPEMMREIEHRLRLSQIESGKAQVTIKLALCKTCRCEFGVNVLDKGVCEFCRGQAAIASNPKPKKRK